MLRLDGICQCFTNVTYSINTVSRVLPKTDRIFTEIPRYAAVTVKGISAPPKYSKLSSA